MTYEEPSCTKYCTVRQNYPHRFEGEWVFDKREGPGKYWCKSKNKLFIGVWSNDVMTRGEIVDEPSQKNSLNDDDTLDELNSPDLMSSSSSGNIKSL